MVWRREGGGRGGGVKVIPYLRLAVLRSDRHLSPNCGPQTVFWAFIMLFPFMASLLSFLLLATLSGAAWHSYLTGSLRKVMTVEREKESNRSYLHSAPHPHCRACGNRWCTSVMWLGSRGAWRRRGAEEKHTDSWRGHGLHLGLCLASDLSVMLGSSRQTFCDFCFAWQSRCSCGFDLLAKQIAILVIVSLLL